MFRLGNLRRALIRKFSTGANENLVSVDSGDREWKSSGWQSLLEVLDWCTFYQQDLSLVEKNDPKKCPFLVLDFEIEFYTK